MSIDRLLEEVRSLERRGQLLSAYDAAVRALSEYPDSWELRYRSVLCLAKSGSLETARRQYATQQLADYPQDEFATLGARLLKDTALRSTDDTRVATLAQAADRYAEVFERSGGYYPGVNAATLYLLAGRRLEATDLAEHVLRILETEAMTNEEDIYFRLAARAEALLVLGDRSAAEASLANASKFLRADYTARAATRRQLRLLCAPNGNDQRWLDAIANPPILHFCGHLSRPEHDETRFDAVDVARVMAEIGEILRRRRPLAGYGSLAGGADILVAESLLELGIDLHVLLPCPVDEFLDASVRACGLGWETRFHACFERATSVRIVAERYSDADDIPFGYASQVAMGLARLHARSLDVDPFQLAVWDRRTADSNYGTAGDVARWRALHLPQEIVNVSSPRFTAIGTRTPDERTRPSRVFRAMLFADVKGFSGIQESALPTFVDEVLGSIADCLHEFRSAIEFRNTWGDGLFLVFNDPVATGECALALQSSICGRNWSSIGLPSDLSLRISCHYGPVHHTRDPILKRSNYFGVHVTRTARIEPITPERSVYVTEPFAALLTMQPNHGLVCDYVGSVPSAKGYGELNLYLLRTQ